MDIAQSWKQRIVEAGALDAIKVPHSEKVMPPFTIPQIGEPFAPRALRTRLIDQLATDPDSVDPSVVGPELVRAIQAGRGEDMLPFTGQSAALVRDVIPAGELVGRLVAEATTALRRSQASLVSE